MNNNLTPVYAYDILEVEAKALNTNPFTTTVYLLSEAEHTLISFKNLVPTDEIEGRNLANPTSTMSKSQYKKLKHTLVRGSPPP